MNDAVAREFASPGSAWRGKPFWSWNGDLQPEELRRQIRVMRRMGMGGFFMHARVGLVTPYLSPRWFECVRACVDEAKKLKMEAWLYDEDRWPSGAAGGLVTKNPAWRQRMLRLVESDDPKAFRWTPRILAAFTAVIKGHAAFSVRPIPRGEKLRRLAQGEKILTFEVRLAEPNDWYNGYTYLDVLNPAAVRQFIRVTHEAYRRECGRWFGNVIPGIFSDEPNGGDCLVQTMITETGAADSLPWTGALPKLFRERYGYDLLPHLPELCYDLEGRGVRPARYHFHDCISHLFATAYAKQIGEWCGRSRLQFTGHVLEEDSLSKQVATTSACMRFYEYMQAPGLDMLTERRRIYDTAKQVSSAARQFGRKWRLTETYGCSGWDFSFAGFKALGDWQVALGINLRCPHLYWYTMQGESKRDFPGPIGEQSPWWTHYAKVEDYFARLHAALTPGEEARDILVIHPVESMWLQVRKNWQEDPARERMNREFGKLRDALLSAHLDFDYGDEELLSRHARLVQTAGKHPVFRVGRATYKAVLVPPMTTIRRTTLRLLQQFREAGGTVVFAGRTAAYVEALRDPGPAALAERCPRTPARGPKLIAALDPLCRRVSITDAAGKEIAGVLYLLREDREAFRLFICNTGYTAAQLRRLGFNEDQRVCERRAVWPAVRVRGFAECAGAPEEWDSSTGRRFAANAERTTDGAWEIATDLPALGSRLFVLPKEKTRRSLPARPVSITLRRLPPAARPWTIGLSEKNVLVFDRAEYHIGGMPSRGEEEILRLDRRVRRALGVPLRGGMMVQPWARKQQAGKKKSVPLALDYRIHVDVLPQDELLLALESPHRFAIAVNGRPISSEPTRGWWVDPSLKLLALDPAWLRLGENRLRLETDYTEDDGLEIIYLLGDFGVQLAAGHARIIAAPERLEIGDWTSQGLPFYAGSVCYRRAIATPRLAKEERLFVRVPGYLGVAVRVLVNGREAGFIGWEPAEADITDFVEGDAFELGIELIGHRRNSHGPLHFAEKWPVQGARPRQFVAQGKDWSDAWNIVPCGLMESPRLEIRKLARPPRRRAR